MAITRDLINKVLLGLRKDQLTSSTGALTEDEHKRLLLFINVAKEEVEESWDWESLRAAVTVTGTPSTSEYTLSAAAAADVDVPQNARLLYERSKEANEVHAERTVKSIGDQPQVFDITTQAEFRLREVTLEQMRRMHLMDENETADPTHFALAKEEDFYRLVVWPTPADARSWVIRFVIPQAELAEDDITTVLQIADRPIWTRALYYANEERGEELGRPNSSLDRQANDALANAIGRETTDEDITGYPQ